GLWRPHGGGAALPEEALLAVSEPAAPRGQPVVIGHYRSGYILAEDDEGLLIVDQHAAHERILFEQLSDAQAGGGGPLQSLLFPRTVQAPSALRGDLESLASDLNGLGFETEPFGDGTLVVRGMPAILAESDPESLVLGILSEAPGPGGAGEGLESRRRRMLATAACHAAVKVPAHLTGEKIAWILARLLECRSPLRCPHGRPTLLRWGHRELERRFGRP
ncbi:MAG TPA: hypothetical protein VNI57_05140, partial [Candidatus Saccharimonadales bacterium]|nr:hypothetical protein [Candidatus Saccharimonadales bacterium]